MSKHLNIAGLLFVTLAFVVNICYAFDDTSQISKPISRITKNISKYKTVDGDAVGFSGQITEQYKRFNSLTKLATDKELVLLTDHKNANVRAYAFWALAKRNFAEIKIVLEKHLSDTALIEYYYGCMLTPKKINSFFLDILTPTHIDAYCFKLSQQEINRYSKLIIELSEQKN